MRIPLSCSLALLVSLSTFAAEPCKRGFMTPDRIVTSALSVDSAAYGDFDEDGRVDVAFTGEYRWAVSINRGNGVFEPIHSEDQPGPYNLTLDRAIDLDRDGHLDLLFVGMRAWARGRGDGSFAAFSDIPYSGGAPNGRPLLVDFDHDNVLDVVTFSASEVLSFRGKGDGSFESTAAASFPDSWLLQQLTVAAGDFDGDGNVDVVRVGFDLRDRVWLASFIWSASTPTATQSTMAFPFAPQSGLHAVDLDGDGSDELLAGSPDNLVALHLRNRVITQETLPFAGRLLSETASPRMADIDADGRRDLLLSFESSVAIFRGTISGLEEPRILGLGGSYGLLLADLDNDGASDIVTRGGEHGLTMIRGGAAILTRPAQRAFPLAFASRQLQLVDIDHDGLQDVVANDGDSMSVAILLNDGEGWFRLASSSRFAPANVSVSGTRVFIGDYDADGHADLAVAPAEASSVRPLLAFGNGTGYFTNVLLELPGTQLVGVLRNANGAASMLVIRDGEVQALRVATTGQVTATTLFAAPANATVRAFDLDDDGSDEIAVVTSSTVAIRKQSGAAWETIHTVRAPFSVFKKIVAADLNGDRVSDLLVVSEGGAILFTRNGSTYEETGEIGSWGFLDDVAAADVDGDSFVDLIVASRHNFGDAGTLQVLRNDGMGRFTPYNTTLTGPPYGSTAVTMDVDRDGAADILISTFDGVELLRNVCVTPRVRFGAVPATVRPGETVRLVIHGLSTDGFAVGPVTISQNGAIVNQSQATRAFDYGTAVWTSAPLTKGRHLFTIDYLDQFAGPSSTTVTVNVTENPPRRRSARH